MIVLGKVINRLDAAVAKQPFAVSGSEMITLALIAILPFLPRPTLDHPVRLVVPAFIVVLLLANARRVSVAFATIPHQARLKELTVFGGLLLLVYFVWSVANGQSSELNRVLARALWIAVYLCLVSWFFVSGISINRIYKCIFWSSVVLSALVIFVGITGATIFEAPRPGRTLGIAIPFFKNTGVPRSYGEFGVLMSMAWAYWLVHSGNMARITRIASGWLLIAAVFVSQSRSAYLAIVVISAAYGINWMVRKSGVAIRKRIFLFFIIGAIFLPVLLEAALASPIGRIGFVKELVGQQTFEENVLVRFVIIGSAVDALLDGGMSSLLGISHAAWNAKFGLIGQDSIALHNHFLSNLVFFGFLGGSASLIVFFFWPYFGAVKRQISIGDRTSLVALLSLLGGVVNLHFYEGFFSLILALELALLWCVSRGIMLEIRIFHRQEI